MKLAVVIPCYNESVTVESTVDSVQRSLPSAEIWVCDNGSMDDTGARARSAGARVLFEPHKGKGTAVRRLFSDVEADVYVMVDGDGTYDAEALPAMVDQLLEQSLDMLVGNRLHTANAGAFRRGHGFGNWLLSWLVRRFFASPLEDLLSGCRIMSRRFVKSFPAESRGFEIETELTVHALEERLPIAEVSMSYFARPLGSASKLSTYRDGLRILRMIVLLFRDVKPLPFFFALAASLACLGLALFYPILQTFLATGEVPRFPTLIVITGMLVLACVFVTCGVILDRLAASRRIQQHFRYLAIPGPMHVRRAEATVSSTGVASDAAGAARPDSAAVPVTPIALVATHRR